MKINSKTVSELLSNQEMKGITGGRGNPAKMACCLVAPSGMTYGCEEDCSYTKLCHDPYVCTGAV